MAILIKRWSTRSKTPDVEEFLRRAAFLPEAEDAAREILADIRARGDQAVLDAALRFDGAALCAADLLVTEAEIADAARKVPARVKRAVRDARTRVERFAKAGMRRPWKMRTPRGGWTGEFYSPLARVGAYVPGGTAPLVSTVIMTVTLAKVAGVREIVVCTPCGADKTVNPVLLYALRTAGATEVYRVGGIQSIGMMAFGTATVRPVLKIVGPGNAYVTAAKRQVYGFVGIDQVAGPSEIAVLADDSANPAWVAADMLSQAEHGSGHEKALLVTDSMVLAKAVRTEIERQTPSLSRASIIRRVVDNNGIMLAVVPDISQGMELVNRFAPEHLEIVARGARALMKQVRAAGAIFLGSWTPEAAGDFVAGPSHVLPTGGAARMFSGLTADDFRLRHSFVEFTRKDLSETRDSIETFAAVEGLDAHGRSATVRFE
jgi:histidinol dehydrogenase